MPSAKFFKIPWMSYADFKAMPEFKNNRIFNFKVNNPDGSKPDTNFIKNYLLCQKPSLKKDNEGFVYIYCLKDHHKKNSFFDREC